MALFVVKHRHEAETCPAGHPEMGPMLLKHMSGSNAEAMGITIRGEAVVDGAHTLYIILEANDREQVDQFVAPFAQMGQVEVLPANVCETVVQRGSC